MPTIVGKGDAENIINKIEKEEELNEVVEEDIINEHDEGKNIHVLNYAKAGTWGQSPHSKGRSLTSSPSTQPVTYLIKSDYKYMNYKAKDLRLNLYQQKWISTEPLCRHPISLGHNVFH